MMMALDPVRSMALQSIRKGQGRFRSELGNLMTPFQIIFQPGLQSDDFSVHRD